MAGRSQVIPSPECHVVQRYFRSLVWMRVYEHRYNDRRNIVESQKGACQVPVAEVRVVRD